MSCGFCCQTLKPILDDHEKEILIDHFGENVIVGEHRLSKITKLGERCFFQRYVDGQSICLLQNTGLKPASCRTYPFVVSVEPLGLGRDEEASLDFNGQEFYVYVDSDCAGVNLGNPSGRLVDKILPEVLKIAISDIEDQEHTTSSRPYSLIPLPRT